MSKKVIFTVQDDARHELLSRASRMARTGPPIKLDGSDRSVQFLRGVFSRASLCLPAFYYFFGSVCAREAAKESNNHSFRVAQTYSEFSDLNTLTLSCRKIFDHSVSTSLTGANFAKVSDAHLQTHAEYWAKCSSKDVDEALTALRFLRRFFKECSKPDSQLLHGKTLLQKRIGLLKQHADRAAAHLSLEDYALKLLDAAHFTAAVSLVGEIVRSFDSPFLGDDYFNTVDASSHQAASRIFPQIAEIRLFSSMKVEQQARLCWQWGEDQGMQMLLDQLPYAISWF